MGVGGGQVMVGECDDRQHSWGGGPSESNGTHIIKFECRRCQVGHDLRIEYTGINQARVDVDIWPARGVTTISRAIVEFFLVACEKSIAEMQQHGVTVEHGVVNVAATATGAGLAPGWSKPPF